MDIAYSPYFLKKLMSPPFSFNLRFFASPFFTMMHLSIMPYTDWTPLSKPLEILSRYVPDRYYRTKQVFVVTFLFWNRRGYVCRPTTSSDSIPIPTEPIASQCEDIIPLDVIVAFRSSSKKQENKNLTYSRRWKWLPLYFSSRPISWHFYKHCSDYSSTHFATVRSTARACMYICMCIHV